MENTTSTIFAQDFVVDSIGYNDKRYLNVNAHELAHQWFGDLVTAKESKHHWLQEGFATYYRKEQTTQNLTRGLVTLSNYTLFPVIS